MGGGEVGYTTYNSFADLLSNTSPSSAFSPIDVAGAFSTTGLAFEGEKVIPEPSTILLLGSGLAGLVAWRYRKGRA